MNPSSRSIVSRVAGGAILVVGLAACSSSSSTSSSGSTGGTGSELTCGAVSGANGGSGGCTITFTNCTDGRTYAISCPAGPTCNCEVNGANNDNTIDGTNYCASVGTKDFANIAGGCSW